MIAQAADAVLLVVRPGRTRATSLGALRAQWRLWEVGYRCGSQSGQRDRDAGHRLRLSVQTTAQRWLTHLGLIIVELKFLVVERRDGCVVGITIPPSKVLYFLHETSRRTGIQTGLR